MNKWRPEGCDNPYNFMNGGAIPKYELQSRCFDEGIDAIMGAIWKLAKESPTGTFTFDSNVINIYGVDNGEET